MGTVSKQIADQIIAGKYADTDGWPQRIIKYTNQWGGESYGVEQRPRDVGKYHESPYCRNCEVYWEKPKDT